jgi:hypothetical protein
LLWVTGLEGKIAAQNAVQKRAAKMGNVIASLNTDLEATVVTEL